MKESRGQHLYQILLMNFLEYLRMVCSPSALPKEEAPEKVLREVSDRRLFRSIYE